MGVCIFPCPSWCECFFSSPVYGGSTVPDLIWGGDGGRAGSVSRLPNFKLPPPPVLRTTSPINGGGKEPYCCEPQKIQRDKA